MPTFTYLAKDNAGKIYRGQKEAHNEQDALQQLTEAGFQVKTIREGIEQPASPVEQLIELDKTANQFISSQEVQTFTRTLVESLSQGQLLEVALKDLASRQQNEHFRQILVQLRRAEVEYGNSFGESIMSCPHVFGRFYIAKVQQAEETGSFADFLEVLRDLSDNPASKIRSGLNWQIVEQDDDVTLFRTKVPGGWLIKSVSVFSTQNKTDEATKEISLTFYPDPIHQWDGASLS